MATQVRQRLSVLTIFFIASVVVLVVGGVNWGVVAIRQTEQSKRKLYMPTDLLDWTNVWFQIVLYYIVGAAAIVATATGILRLTEKGLAT